MFVDRVTIYVSGGAGGDGCMSFRREKYAPRGGPNGGDGGRGGHVMIRATEGQTNLAHLSHQRHWRATRGDHGQGSDCFGRGGEDLVIEVPPGTLIRDRDRGYVLRDLEGARRRGDRGPGRPRRSRQRPLQVVDQPGASPAREGTSRRRTLDRPGAEGHRRRRTDRPAQRGQVHAAVPDLPRHPEIADYPFTTKYPNLGTVVAEDQNFVVADIPGLIEGAHAGHGLGHEFLRHVERTHLLVHLVEAMPIDGSDPLHNYRTIRNELAEYSKPLAERPELLVVTKMDVTGAEEARERIETRAGPGSTRDLGRHRAGDSRSSCIGSSSSLRAEAAGSRSRAAPPTPRADGVRRGRLGR